MTHFAPKTTKFAPFLAIFALFCLIFAIFSNTACSKSSACTITANYTKDVNAAQKAAMIAFCVTNNISYTEDPSGILYQIVERDTTKGMINLNQIHLLVDNKTKTDNLFLSCDRIEIRPKISFLISRVKFSIEDFAIYFPSNARNNLRIICK